MRARLILALLLLSTSAAQAASEGGRTQEPGTHVEMPFLIAPMSVDGKLQGYAYISSKLVATSPSASIEIREKLAFIQDAFVRDVNAAPIGKASDPLDVDNAALAVRLVADAKRIVGAAKVDTIAFKQIQFAPLHPKPTTDDAIPPSERAPQAPPAQAAPAKP